MVTGVPGRPSAENLHQHPQASCNFHCDSGYCTAVPLHLFSLTPLLYYSRDIKLVLFYSPDISYFTVGVLTYSLRPKFPLIRNGSLRGVTFHPIRQYVNNQITITL